MNHTRLLRPAEQVESILVKAILSGEYPAGSYLPAERELAIRLGITRPTLRETLQRLEGEGWLEIHQGKATRVKDYLTDGSLTILSKIAEQTDSLPTGFVDNLLEVREVLAPAYAELAVINQPDRLSEYLLAAQDLENLEGAYTSFDWDLHRLMARCSGNVVFGLILNGFSDLYDAMGRLYFHTQITRDHSASYYLRLADLSASRKAKEAGELTRRVMVESREMWSRIEK